MSRIGIFIKILVSFAFLTLLLTGCHDEPYYPHEHNAVGYLKIYNHTNAPITVTWTADDTQNSVEANSARTFEFDMDASINTPQAISTTYNVRGIYLHSVTKTDEVYENQITVRDFDPNMGCLRFVNQTAGPLGIAVNGLDDIVEIPAYEDYIQSWQLEDDHAVVNFGKSGDFVFESSGTSNIFLNSTGTYTVYATGAAIRVRNYSNSPISEVYISPHSDSGWGENDLYGTISPNHYVIWTVSPNTWDVKVANLDGYYSSWVNNDFIDLNQYLTIDFDPSKVSDKHVETKPMGPGSPHAGKFKIQQVR